MLGMLKSKVFPITLSIILVVSLFIPQLISVKALSTTMPTDESATSLYMSNWKNSVNLWMASKLSQNDTGNYGPRIGEMRIANDYATNQIKDYSSFFRDETNGVKYTQPHNFASQAYYDENGILRTKYLNYGSSQLPIEVTKDFAMVPNQDFMVATYTFKNSGTSSIDYNVLEQIHVNNKSIGNGNYQNHAWYDSSKNAMYVDMSSSGQYYIALGAFQKADSFQVANDRDANLGNMTVAPWYTFDNNGTLKNNSDIYAEDISVAFQDKVTIPANSSISISFVATVQDTLSKAQAAVSTATSQSVNYWFTQTTNSYSNWLKSGKTVNFDDEGLNLAYKRGLVTIKNAINPSYGTTPATTNPIAYGYKVWARDSAVTAMILDQAGFYEDAKKYWYWLQDRQEADGTFKTTFDYWTNNYVSFVEPEHDSIGIFLVGAYQHYKLTGDTTFLNNIWTKYKKSADFVWSHLGSNPYGYGEADASIWEEQIEYNGFTQALYVAGLDSAQHMARAMNLSDLADNYNGASSKIRSNIQKNDSWNPSGLWNDSNGYFNRAVNTDGTPRTLVDASSNALMVYGVLDSLSSRANSHVNKIKTNLQHDNYGVSRYDGDTFYYTASFSPAGNEALSDEPTWPQMSSYIALHHIYRGEKQTALEYLKWIVSRMGAGYMAQGEAVSRVTFKPLQSTMVEPVTAAWYIGTALAYEGKADLRIIPPQYNAGAYKSINITSNVVNDLAQWNNVPYYKDNMGDTISGAGETDINKVYISNDSSNLYIRIKNKSGSLPGFNTSPRFAMMVFSEDFKNAAIEKKGTGLYGGKLDRQMSFMVGRWSDSDNYSKFLVGSGNWNFVKHFNNVINPQWSTSSGDMEMVIPLSEFSSSGTVNNGDWANINVVIARQDPSSLNWSEDDVSALHYRITTSGEQWTYGNVE
ncbi:glycoside hydrolase family 15 protein [Mesobacillus subterraneus]|uniref:glycoside hydrolase family 15 protein n=1 Tax=Mesobacillus subterraneus TaxID=285983 RepID=UPI00069BB4F1|nr:glycoside hydrolase family 15 protein [Mesobacillus subterraneus]